MQNFDNIASDLFNKIRGRFPEFLGLGENFAGFRPQIRLRHVEISLRTSFESNSLEW